MKARLLLTVTMATILWPVPSALSQPAGQRPDALKTFANALDQAGFQVSVGASRPLNPAAEWCAGNPAFPHALYANNQPYLMFLVPKSADDAGLGAVFQMREDEAIVIIGLTPPPEKYYGYHAFLSSKVYPTGRKRVWSTLGDTVNNATIKTLGPTPFNSPVALIYTPDRGTDTRVRAALKRAGYPAAIINTIVIPSSMLNLGYGDAADELRINARNGIWLDPIAGEAYLAHPPLSVFRVTPRTPATADPFPMPALRVRGTGHTEMALLNKLDELRKGIMAANPGLHATDIPTKPNFYEGFDYIQQGLDPYGDSRDAFWMTGGWLPDFGCTNRLTLADDEFLVVYGVNHVASGKATYASVNVYASDEAKLTLGGIDDRDFAGTASPYLPGDPAADLMYVYKVSRNCGSDTHCIPLSIDNCSRLTLDSNTLLGVIFRTYLEPATKVGPALPEVLYDRIIKFSPRP
ncbi:MAG TPA: hypothetical protein VGM51_12040 [Armatimonadota bacterium]|jgi:hypothetical protein